MLFMAKISAMKSNFPQLIARNKDKRSINFLLILTFPKSISCHTELDSFSDFNTLDLFLIRIQRREEKISSKNVFIASCILKLFSLFYFLDRPCKGIVDIALLPLKGKF